MVETLENISGCAKKIMFLKVLIFLLNNSGFMIVLIKQSSAAEVLLEMSKS